MTVDPKWIRSKVDEIAVEQDCYFDDEAGERVCNFIETYCRQSKDRWAGKKIVLLGWQRDFLMRLFGWKKANGLRRYERAYLEVAKKNGKSTLVSALVLYLLMADGAGGPEVYLNACDKEQAGIIFDEAVKMVKASPELSDLLTIVNSKGDKRITFEDDHGKIVANSSVAASKDGFNPSAVVFDELHLQPDRAMWAIFEFASAAREQPLIISITTAGEAMEGVWFEQREVSEKINKGEVLDITHLGVVYRALETDNLDDIETWRKANPSLGETIDPDKFARELADSKLDPAKWANFLRRRLNIIQREDVKFLAPGQWESCKGPTTFRPGDACWAGLDLSSVEDLTALVAIFGDPDDGFDVRAWFWLPEDNIAELERKHRQPYRSWADLDLIILTDGNAIDYGSVRREINELAAEHDLRKLLADPAGAHMLAQQLRDKDGIPIEMIRQGSLSMNAPTKELLRLILQKKIRHGGNPILNWMAGNAVAKVEDGDLMRLSKKKSRNKIDGMAALVNAIAAATDGKADDGQVHDTHGIGFI